MFEQLAVMARPVLDLPVVRRTRRNHGLEHATIHILASRIKGLQMAGRSTDSGFVLIGEAPTEQIEASVNEALRRMRGGEHSLAVHPNCGTNLVTTGFMTSVVGVVGMTGASRKDTFNRLPGVMVLMMFTVLFSQPVGMALQKHFTTDGDPADLEIVSITRSNFNMPLANGPVTMHRVVTRSS
jgi:hypothetical protein